MIELAMILSVALSAALLLFTGFRISDEHASIRILFVSVGLLFVIGTTFTGYKFALANGYGKIAGYLIYFVLAGISVFTVYVFYLFWLYIKSTSLIASGTNDEFKEMEL